MNVGAAITAALQEQRRRDWNRMLLTDRGTLRAWLWWGWHIDRPGGLGYPGTEYPHPRTFRLQDMLIRCGISPRSCGH